MIALAWLAACTEYGYSDATWTDTFQQDRANAVDLLIVIDNSCSMVEEQENLARNFDALLSQFVEAEVDWRIGVTTTDSEEERFRGRLQGGDDEVILRGPTGEIDRVAYDRTWGFTDGVSLVLSGERLDRSENDVRAAWCRATAEYAPGLRGNPGARNPRCDGQPTPIPPAGADLGPRPPGARDLVISELLPQSGVDDRLCEWVEITSTTPDTLALEGLVLSDAGSNRVVLPAFQLPPYGAFVVGRSTECGAPVDFAFEQGFTLNDDLRYIDATRPAAAELFAEAVAQGTVGTGIETGYEAARLVFEEPYYSEQNASWLRDSAKLALLFVSDEDDLSPWPVDAYLDRFAALKGLAGYRDPQWVTVSAVVAVDQPPNPEAPACISENGVAFHGRRYIAGANRTGGLAESICTEDFAPIVSRLGLTLSGLTLEFALSRLPLPNSIKVSLYADRSSDSWLGDLEPGIDFSYDGARNLIVFDADQAPPASTYLVVRYQLLPRGASNDPGDDPAPTPEPGQVP